MSYFGVSTGRVDGEVVVTFNPVNPVSAEHEHAVCYLESLGGRMQRAERLSEGLDERDNTIPL